MTPLVLLVGFLGSGKTTYLRNLLPQLQRRGIDPHVIINDYQNAKVDAQLLEGAAQSVVPISGSCVCCGSRDELMDALGNFEAGAGRVMLVEANGTTDAEELLEILSLDPRLDRFSLPIQLSLVDGKRWQKRFWHNGLELDQVRTAGFVHISRQADLDGRRIAVIRESFGNHGIRAREVDVEAFALEIANVLDMVESQPARRVVNSTCGCGHDHRDEHETHHSDADHDHDHGGGHGHRHAEHHFSSYQFDLPGHLPRKALEEFLSALPREVIRAKGLVRLEEADDEYFVFQKIDQFEEAQILSIGSVSRLDNPVAVFIGPGIDEALLRDRIARLNAAAAAS